MNNSSAIRDLLDHYPELSVVIPSMEAALQLLADCYDQGGTVFTCGNGGSCSDAEHITGELLKGFCKKRPIPQEDREKLAAIAPEDCDALVDKLQCGLRAVPLLSLQALNSAAANDLGQELGPAQALYAMGRPGDVFIGLSTSGNALNVRRALAVAKLKGIKTIGFTGGKGGYLAANADVAIKAPATDTYRIQEYHLPIYHALCRLIEERYFTV